jgi:hypothetical protein
MRVDKKARGDRLRFVVLDGSPPGDPRSPTRRCCVAAYSEVADKEDKAGTRRARPERPEPVPARVP